ncbi:hypothetical protein GWK26_07950 [haloarchaeon 3A1-DGR]|nr:hypothetical protein GWK26_07950 [haloarchaeon 3A1-DGR]
MTNDGSAFDPDDLDFTRDERVTEIDDGRYVVSAGDGPPRVPRDEDSLADLLNEVTDADESVAEAAADAAADAATADAAAEAAADESSPTAAGPDAGDTGGRNDRSRGAVTSQDVSRWLAASFEGDGFAYGFDATLSVDDEVVRHRMVSNDVTAAFETLLTWFTRHAASEAPPDEALGILVAAAELPVQYPPGTLERYLDRHDLDPEDSIADLLRVAEAHGGLRIDTGADESEGADVETNNDADTDETRSPKRTNRRDERVPGFDDSPRRGRDDAAGRTAAGERSESDAASGFGSTGAHDSPDDDSETGSADDAVPADDAGSANDADPADDAGAAAESSWDWVGSDVDARK